MVPATLVQSSEVLGALVLRSEALGTIMRASVVPATLVSPTGVMTTFLLSSRPWQPSGRSSACRASTWLSSPGTASDWPTIWSRRRKALPARALRAGLRWLLAEMVAGRVFVDLGGQSGGALSPGGNLLAPELVGGTQPQTRAPQSRGLALSRQRHPRGRLLQAPGGHPLLTAMRVARALRQLTALLARVHWAQRDAARRLLARSAGVAVLAPAALLTLGAA